MGAAWRDRPEWEAVVGRAEAALGEPLGRLLLDADADELLRTRNAQLAVLLTSLLAWEAISDRVVPLAFAGHSLGQVTALIASGVLPFDDGVRFAAVRADRTQAAADATPGVMAALLGATLEQAEAAAAAATSAGSRTTTPRARWCWRARRPDSRPASRRRRRRARARPSRSPSVAPSTPRSCSRRPTRSATTSRRSPFSAPSAPVVSNDDGEPYSDAEGWRTRSAAHVAVPGPVAGGADDARRRSARTDCSRSGTARCSRRSPSARSRTRR